MTTLSLTIPDQDKQEFCRLAEDCRREVRAWLCGFAVVAKHPHRGAAMAELGRAMRVSASTARRKWDDFRHSGDWHVLINGAKYMPTARRLPAEFIEYYQALVEEYQRVSAPAYRELLRRWRAGQPIPGYEFPPVDCGKGHPEGWGERNLYRHLPTKFELKAMREGLGAAMAAFGPQILTTRVGLYVGSHYLIDDVTRDLKVTLLTNGGKIARIQELGVLDLFSADRFAVHRRPQFTRDSDGKKDSLKEREMRFLIAAVLRNTGYSPRGTEIASELGTAAVRKKFAQWIRDTISPLITVRYGGITGKEQAVAGYWGRGGGNPRHKAPLESHHNLLHNEASWLPAQTGHDMSYPEWLAGVEAITEDVIGWMQTLPPERASLLRLPMLEYWQSLELLREIDDRIAWRTRHNLQGWVECGHTTMEFRRDLLRDEWLSPNDFLALPSSDQAQLAAIAEQYPAFRRPRKLAPREVFGAGMGSLIKAPDHLIALMFCDRDLGDDLRITKSLTANNVLELTDVDVEPEAMTFEGYVVAPDGSHVRLQERQKYGVVLNLFDRDALWVYDPRGGFLGTAPRRVRVSQLDERPLEIALGNRSHEKAELLAPLRDRHAGSARLMLELQEHNRRVVAGEPVTPEAKADARRLEKKTNAVFSRSSSSPSPEPTQPLESITDEFFSR